MTMNVQGTKMTIILLEQLPENDSQRPAIVEQLAIFANGMDKTTREDRELYLKAEALILKHQKSFGL